MSDDGMTTTARRILDEIADFVSLGDFAQETKQEAVDNCDALGAELDRLTVALAEREAALYQAEQQLLYWWDWKGGPCPCGARAESLDTHPHTIGCPTGRARQALGQKRKGERG